MTVLVVQHQDRVPLGRLTGLGRHGPGGLDLRVVRPDRGEPLPATTGGLAGLVVLGGTMAAWEDDVAPWLPAVRDLLRTAVAYGLPTLGVCLGAQLLAMATGGRVERGPDGPELGVVPVTLTQDAAADDVAGGLPPTFPAPQGHSDVVSGLPPDAVHLAASSAYPHQLFRVGERAWGVQYHPEVERTVFENWMTARAPQLSATGRTPAGVLADFDAAEPDLAAIAAAHAAAFAAVVRSRPRAGGQPAAGEGLRAQEVAR